MATSIGTNGGNTDTTVTQTPIQRLTEIEDRLFAAPRFPITRYWDEYITRRLGNDDGKQRILETSPLDTEYEIVRVLRETKEPIVLTRRLRNRHGQITDASDPSSLCIVKVMQATPPSIVNWELRVHAMMTDYFLDRRIAPNIVAYYDGFHASDDPSQSNVPSNLESVDKTWANLMAEANKDSSTLYLRDTATLTGNPVMCIEYATRGDLQQYKESNVVTARTVHQLFWQMLYVHAAGGNIGFVQTDIKPPNMAVTDDAPYGEIWYRDLADVASSEMAKRFGRAGLPADDLAKAKMQFVKLGEVGQVPLLKIIDMGFSTLGEYYEPKTKPKRFGGGGATSPYYAPPDLVLHQYSDALSLKSDQRMDMFGLAVNVLALLAPDNKGFEFYRTFPIQNRVPSELDRDFQNAVEEVVHIMSTLDLSSVTPPDSESPVAFFPGGKFRPMEFSTLISLVGFPASATELGVFWDLHPAWLLVQELKKSAAWRTQADKAVETRTYLQGLVSNGTIDQKLVDLLYRMLSPDIRKRPSALEVLVSERWLTEMFEIKGPKDAMDPRTVSRWGESLQPQLDEQSQVSPYLKDLQEYWEAAQLILPRPVVT